jgi:hypothetical protein
MKLEIIRGRGFTMRIREMENPKIFKSQQRGG